MSDCDGVFCSWSACFFPGHQARWVVAEFPLIAVFRFARPPLNAAAARTLGVVERTLFNWVKAERQGKLEGADSKVVSSSKTGLRLRPSNPIRDSAKGYAFRGEGQAALAENLC